MKGWLSLGLISLCLALSTQVMAAIPDSDEVSTPVNRLDFTYAAFDSDSLDKLTGFFGYTRSLSPKSNLNLRVAYLESRFGVSGGTGLGDTTLTWSYLPNFELSVGPWVPRIIGSGVLVVLPTGNEKQGRGLGSTIVTPFVGTVIPVTDTFSIAPNLLYAYSIDPIFTGNDVRVGLLDLGLSLVRNSGWWVNFYFGYIYDFEADNTSFGNRLSFGKRLSNGLGLSAHYIDYESFAPGITPIATQQYNRLYELTISYSF
jgi:hypothetical protein